MNALTKLKGVGPATASLILSAYAPDEIPFFSDEMYNFFAAHGGVYWRAKIKAYGVKQYREVVWEGWHSLRARLGAQGEGKAEISACDLEKAVWVWAREAESEVRGSVAPQGEGPKPLANRKRDMLYAEGSSKPAKRQSRSSDKRRAS